MTRIKLQPDINQDEWSRYCDIWETSENIILDLSLFVSKTQIEHLCRLALSTPKRCLSLSTLSEMAERDCISEGLQLCIFDTGDRACIEAIALRENLSNAVLVRCLQEPLTLKLQLKLPFLELMHFPKEWLEFGLYPDELFIGQVDHYLSGDEDGSEHYRNGAFHWWLKRNPTRQQLSNLIQLTFLDRDSLMAGDVRKYITGAKNIHENVPQRALNSTTKK